MVVLLCGACGEQDSGKKRRDASVVDAQPKVAPDVQHEVKEGETLWDIARSYDLRIADIIAANKLSAVEANLVRPGQVLRIPGAMRPVAVETAQDRQKAHEAARAKLPALSDGAYHFLAPGESLWSLARMYDVPLDVIMKRNSLSDEQAAGLKPGAAIVIPGVKANQIKQTETVAREGFFYRLQTGETVWDLARRYHVAVAEIMAANNFTEAQVAALKANDQVWIPGVTRDTKGAVQPRTTQRQRGATAGARRLGLGTQQAAGHILRGAIRPQWIRAAGGAGKLPGTLRWPVAKGWFVRGFGSGEAGYHLAVDIMGKIGWNVRAAAPGIVAYSGDKVRGYGNMVLVIHPGGWATMYAHNSVNFVVAGEKVQRGSVLAEVGSTGISRGPHVHFELIFRGQNCDPVPLFRPGVRHCTKPARTARANWTHPAKRPKVVSCAARRRHPHSRWVTDEDPGSDSEAPAVAP